MVDLGFSFTATCWLWQGKGTWHFITLPKDKSDEIMYFSRNLSDKRRGWGAVRVIATIGKTKWETSIFPHKKEGAYILPLKAEVRKKEQVAAGDSVLVTLQIEI